MKPPQRKLIKKRVGLPGKMKRAVASRYVKMLLRYPEGMGENAKKKAYFELNGMDAVLFDEWIEDGIVHEVYRVDAYSHPYVEMVTRSQNVSHECSLVLEFYTEIASKKRRATRGHLHPMGTGAGEKIGGKRIGSAMRAKFKANQKRFEEFNLFAHMFAGTGITYEWWMDDTDFRKGIDDMYREMTGNGIHTEWNATQESATVVSEMFDEWNEFPKRVRRLLLAKAEQQIDAISGLLLETDGERLEQLQADFATWWNFRENVDTLIDKGLQSWERKQGKVKSVKDIGHTMKPLKKEQLAQFPYSPPSVYRVERFETMGMEYPIDADVWAIKPQPARIGYNAISDWPIVGYDSGL